MAHQRESQLKNTDFQNQRVTSCDSCGVSSKKKSIYRATGTPGITALRLCMPCMERLIPEIAHKHRAEIDELTEPFPIIHEVKQRP